MSRSNPGRFDPRRSWRQTLAAKMLVGGLALSLVLILSVAGFLIASRAQQNLGAADSNAKNRVLTVRQLIQHVTAPQTRYAATDLAQLTLLRTALGESQPQVAVAALFAPGSKVAVKLPDQYLIVADSTGAILYSDEPANVAHIDSTLPSLGSAIKGTAVEGVEMITPTRALYDVATPVRSSAGEILGAVIYSAPLDSQIRRFSGVVGYPTVFISTSHPASTIRDGTLATTPADVASQVASGTDIISSNYVVPGPGEVAAVFAALAGPGTTAAAGYVGVEVPFSVFTAGEASDNTTVLLLAVAALAVTCLIVIMFVNRFLRRPVGQLDRDVSRIASGDYTSEVAVDSEDELGRLAGSVNRMRQQIRTYIERIDSSVAQLGDVSRALTTTTAGVRGLQQAVLKAAVAMAGEGASATLLIRGQNGLEPQANASANGTEPPFLDSAQCAQLLSGWPVRSLLGRAPLLALPMFYQEGIVGALAVHTTKELAESDEQALTALANNAAIALENTRLYEQERQTVKRLRELDAMKSDFLSTTQHELRTPILAIQGQIELITLAWEQWDDVTKLDLIRDIDISTRLLSEITETIIDFSLLSEDVIPLRLTSVNVAASVAEAVDDIGKHFKGRLPIELESHITPDLYVKADAARFRQVVRALLDNAVKFTPAGGNVRIVAAPNDDATCRIDIEDRGIGISQEALPHIFERFYQEDNSKTRTHGGMGMGLALVKRLCEAHHATVAVESQRQKGSKFTLIWPRASAPAPQSPGAHDGFHLVADRG